MPSNPHAESLPIAPADAVVRLEWTGSLPVDSTPATSAIPSAPPPSYAHARVPDRPVTYSFSRMQHGTSAMLLLPPADHPDTRPIYYICVDHDPIFPNLFITTVCRGWNADCPVVGSFGTVTGPSTLMNDMQSIELGGRRYALWSVIRHSRRYSNLFGSSKGDSTFTWSPPGKGHHLVWKCAWDDGAFLPAKCQCYIQGKTELLATFTPTNRTLGRSTKSREATLTTMPAAHRDKHLDAIVLSCMLLERHLLTPTVVS